MCDLALTGIKQTSPFPRPILFFQVNYGSSMSICRWEPPTQTLDIQKSCSSGCLSKTTIYVHSTTACLCAVNSVLFRNKQKKCAVCILCVLSDTSWKKNTPLLPTSFQELVKLFFIFSSTILHIEQVLYKLEVLVLNNSMMKTLMLYKERVSFIKTSIYKGITLKL